MDPVGTRTQRKPGIVGHKHADPARPTAPDEKPHKPLARLRIPVSHDHGGSPRQGGGILRPVRIDSVIRHQDQPADRTGWRTGVEPARHSCKLASLPVVIHRAHAAIHNS